MNAKFCGGRLYRAALRCGTQAAFIEPRAAGMPLPVREAPSPLFYVLHLFADLFDLVFEGEGGAGDL